MIGRGQVGRAFVVPAVSELTEYQLEVRRGVPRPLAARGLRAAGEYLRPCYFQHGETDAESEQGGANSPADTSGPTPAAAIAAGGGRGTPRSAESDRSSRLPKPMDGLRDDRRAGASGAGARLAVVSPRGRPECGNELVAGVTRSTLSPTADPNSSLYTSRMRLADHPWSDCSPIGEAASWTTRPSHPSRLARCDRFPSRTW